MTDRVPAVLRRRGLPAGKPVIFNLKKTSLVNATYSTSMVKQALLLCVRRAAVLGAESAENHILSIQL